MVVCACRVTLHLAECHSLKEKRQVLRSVLTRVRNQFQVAAAEVDDQSLWQLATLGLCYVSNDQAHANEVISRALNFLERAHSQAELTDYEMEVVHLF